MEVIGQSYAVPKAGNDNSSTVHFDRHIDVGRAAHSEERSIEIDIARSWVIFLSLQVR